jgi:hypothetical protein
MQGTEYVLKSIFIQENFITGSGPVQTPIQWLSLFVFGRRTVWARCWPLTLSSAGVEDEMWLRALTARTRTTSALLSIVHAVKKSRTANWTQRLTKPGNWVLTWDKWIQSTPYFLTMNLNIMFPPARNSLEDLGADERIILQCILKKWYGVHGLNWPGSG